MSENKAGLIIQKARENDIHVLLDGDALKIKFLRNTVPDQGLIDLIRENKEMITLYLREHPEWNDRSFQQAGGKPISPVKDQSSYPLSSSQRRMWALSQLEEGSKAYHVYAVYVLEGDLDMHVLSLACNKVIARHEILRTVFKEDEQGVVNQFIQSDEQSPLTTECRDLRHEQDQENTLRQLVQSALTLPFDLAAGPLIRTRLYRMADQKWIFACVMHHIISDAWSGEILFKELMQVYNAMINGKEALLPPLQIQYKDYAVWQQEQLASDALREHRQYWLQQFDDPLPVLELSTDRSRPPVKTYRGRIIKRVLPAALYKGLQLLVKEQECTLFMGLLGVVNALLYRYTGQEEIIIGTPVAGRDHIDLEDQIGFYVNTLALRTHCSEGESFSELLAHIKKVAVAAYEHRMYPFDELINDLRLQRDLSRHPLFDVMIVLQQAETTNLNEQLSLRDVQVGPYDVFTEEISKFDLSFNFEGAGDELQLKLWYNGDIYDEPTIERLGKHMEQLLAAIIDAPHVPVNRLDYVSNEEKHQLLHMFNNTTAGYLKDTTIIDLFEAQVRQTPDAVALVFDNEQMTYRAVNERANQLAHYLVKKGVRAESLVPLCMHRSFEMIIGILAIMKAGGAYIPVEPGYPDERIQFILTDSGAGVVVTNCHLTALQAANELAVINYKDEFGQICHEPVSNLENKLKPAQLAYVIYTSGSTGNPKGVLIEHLSLQCQTAWFCSQYKISKADSSLLLTSFAFDGCITAIWPVLINGGTLHLPADTIFDAERIINYISRHTITYIRTLPPIFKALVNAENFAHTDMGDSLRFITVSGERIIAGDLKKYLDKYPAVLLANHYGPTECTVSASYHIIDRSNINNFIQRPVIGRPVHNTRIYIIEKNTGMLCPVGVPGEIVIGGIQVGRGYLNRPELTAGKFIPDIFSGDTNAGMYCTGDIGKWHADGTIAFLGRIDDQVKIRGYRVEIGEIEKVMQSCALVKQGIVVAREDNDHRTWLVGYIVPNGVFDKNGIVAWLKRSLPDYMVPALLVEMKQLPLTANGKIDRKALPDPVLHELSSNTYSAPQNETEEVLAEIWQTVLNIQRIGTADNFFELGGHSLLIAKVIVAIRKKFGITLHARIMFELPAIRDLAKYIELRKTEASVEKKKPGAIEKLTI
jgi:amino acid adenylation domain-containing protein